MPATTSPPAQEDSPVGLHRALDLGLVARVLCRTAPELSASAAAVPAEPIRCPTATGTVVVPG